MNAAPTAPVKILVHGDLLNIETDGVGCLATLVGPRVFLTPAHCAKNGATAHFKFKGQKYQAMIAHSPFYLHDQHELAVGLVSHDVKDAFSFTVGKWIDTGDSVRLLATSFGKTPGKTSVAMMENFNLVTNEGATATFGDAGGAVIAKGAVVGIINGGNGAETTYSTNLTHPVSLQFLKDFGTVNQVEICGVNSGC